MQMQPSASCARMWTVLSVTTMFADKPHRLNGRTSAQRFCVWTILPPVTALAVGLPAQRAIAQRFRALAPNGHAAASTRCLLQRNGHAVQAGQFPVLDPEQTFLDLYQLQRAAFLELLAAEHSQLTFCNTKRFILARSR